jgi:isochorismate pyruvate lyase
MSVKPPEDCASLEDVRRGIDALDLDIIRLIGERSQYVKAAAKFKTSEAGVRAPERRQAMLEERRQWAEQEGLNPDTIEKLYEDLIDYFIGRELENWRSAD